MGVSGRWSSSVLARGRAKVVVSAALFGALVVLLLPGNSVRAVAGAASAPLAAVAGSPATLTLTLGTDTVTADGTSRRDVRARVVDANNNPVSGDLVSTANLLDVVRRLPTSGLVTKMRGLAGSKGSTPAGQY